MIFWKWINSINIWWFYTKKFFKSPLAYIGIFFLPLMFIVGLGSILHTSGIFVETIGFSLLFIEAITFGSTYFSMKKSTLSNNSELSNMKNYEINFAVFLLMMVVGGLTLIYSVGLFILIEHYTNILVDLYAWDATSPFMHANGVDVTETIKIRWADVDFWAVLYYGFLYTAVMYSLSIFLTAFTNTQKTFFIMILGFITYTLIFGGIMSTMFGASDAKNVPMVPTEETPLVASPWKAPALNLNQHSWAMYASFLNPLYWVNEWGFFLFGNHAYYNIQFNEQITIDSTWISDNLTKNFDVYFKLHEGTFVASNFDSNLYEQNLYHLSYTANGNEFSLYNYSNNEVPIYSSDQILTSKKIEVSSGDVFSIKQTQSLAPNIKYFKWSESWQYNASLILPYAFILVFEFSTNIINYYKRKKSKQ